MKIFFALLFVMCVLASAAQPVFTADNAQFYSGQILNQVQTSGLTSVPMDTGADMVWDYSGVEFGDSLIYILGTMNVEDAICDIPSATFISAHTSPGNSYGYIHLDPGRLALVGSANLDDIDAVCHNYVDGRDIWRYPMAYGDSFTDAYQLFSNSTLGSSTVEYLGYGTVIFDDIT